MTEQEYRKAIAEQQEILNKAIAQAKENFKRQCYQLRMQYFKSCSQGIKVGDVITGQVYYGGKPMNIKVEQIQIHPVTGYKFVGTRLKNDGTVSLQQLPEGTGLYADNVTAINGISVK